MSSHLSQILLTFYMYLLVILLFSVKLGYGKQKFTSCDYKLSKDTKSKNVTVVGSYQRVSSGDFEAYFNLCNDLPPEDCGEGLKICIRKKSDNTKYLFGNELQPAYLTPNMSRVKDSLNLKNLTAIYCDKLSKIPQVLVVFICEDDSKDEAILYVNDECNFEIHVLHPLCTPRCTTRVQNSLVDLRPLTNIYHVYGESGNFSIGLCQSNPECEHSGSDSCLIKQNETIPLAGALENLQYYEETNLFKIRGKFKGQFRSLDKILEIQIKCDWTKIDPVLFYMKMPNNPKTFHFEMLTSYGCVKLDIPYQLKHGPYIFDFESLHKKNGYWKISLPDNREILLNIFGPLLLPEQNNPCAKTNSQVCFKNGSNYLNLGSIQSPTQLDNDVISVTFSSGSRCNKTQLKQFEDPYQEYHTTIYLFCDNTEQGPQFVNMTECETRLMWYTPTACPKYDKSDCKNIHSTVQNCVFNLDGHVYNLTGLYQKNGKYVIEDPKENSEYILNICGPAVDDEIPCNDNNLIYLKRTSEPDVRKRVAGLGKMKNFISTNNQLILELSSGGLCEPHDYKSFIYFECSEKEEQLQLKDKSDCRYEFLWKTPAACPFIQTKTDTQCVFEDYSTSRISDLSKLKQSQKYITMKMSGMTYVFDICNSYKEDCKEGCVHVPAEKHLLTVGSNTYLEFSLNNTCNSPKEFNRTLMELKCDPIKDNDHYEPPSINNCILTYTLMTHLACTEKDSSFYLYDVAEDNRNIKSEQYGSASKNCTIRNPKTQFSFEIANLNLNFHTNKCPVCKFNYTKNLTELTFETERLCRNQNNKGSKFRYTVLLKCSDTNSSIVQETSCQEIHVYESFKYCKLLESLSINNSLNGLEITGIVIGVLLIVAAICILFSSKCIRRRLQYREITRVQYCKNADL